MSRTAEILLVVALLLALPVGAYVAGVMVGPPPRAERTPAATVSPAADAPTTGGPDAPGRAAGERR